MESTHFWQEKLTHLRKAEAAASDASEKFKLSKDIEEAERQLGRNDTRLGIRDDDSSSSGVEWKSHDAALLQQYFEICATHDSFFTKHAQGDQAEILQYLLASGLAAVVNDHRTELTDAGLLLTCRRDLLPRKNYHVDVKFQQKRSAVDSENEELWGAVLYLYFELLDRLRPLFDRRVGSPRERDASGSEMVFFEYPPTAIIEALVNFLIHRNYASDDLGRITVYADRVQFSNPGKSLIPVERLLTSERPLEPKYSRNPRLIEAMNKARLNQREGGGILRIRKELEANRSYRSDGSLGLSIENDDEQDRFVLTIYKRTFGSTGEARETSDPADSQPSLGHAPIPAPGAVLGREKEIARLVDRLLTERPGQIVILGAPGMGKTTLALAAMHDVRVAARYGERRTFINCDALQTRKEIVAAIAGNMFSADFRDVELQVVRALSESPSLLVLDGLERAWDADGIAVEELLTVLAAVDSLALIVTLRGSSRPRGLQWGPSIDVAPLSADTARELFLAIASTRFADDPHLAPLLEALDGIPLAITLMARYAEVYPSLDPVWRAWCRKRTAILRDGDSRDRRSNLEVSFSLSLSVLSDAAKRILSALALLPAGIASDDADRLVDDADGAMHELRTRALVFDQAKRIRMLAPLREYVERAHPSEEEHVQRITRFYLDLITREGARIGGSGGAEAVAILVPEVANLERLLLRSLRIEGNPSLEAFSGWGWFVYFTGLGSSVPLEQFVDKAVVTDRVRDAGVGFALLGNIALSRANYAYANNAFDRARSIFHVEGSIDKEATAVENLGNLAAMTNNLETAAERYAEALSLYRQIGDIAGEANVIAALGHNLATREEYEGARRNYEEALMLYARADDLFGGANANRGLGEVLRAMGDHTGAREHFDQALSVFRRLGAIRNAAFALLSLGDLAAIGNDRAGAVQRYREALSILEHTNDVYFVGTTHRRLSRVAQDENSRRAHADAAREAFHRLGRPDLVATVDDESLR